MQIICKLTGGDVFYIDSKENKYLDQKKKDQVYSIDLDVIIHRLRHNYFYVSWQISDFPHL